MRGSLSSYAVFFYRRLKDPKRRFTAVTFIIFGFLICAFIGRFAIGFLGLAFNIVETADYKAPLFRPSWDNKTIGSESQ